MKSNKIKADISEIGKTLESLDFGDSVKTKVFIFKLLNLIELQHNEIEHLRAENRKLKDEINKLKGQKGKPKIKENKYSNDDQHFTSGIEPKKSKLRKKTKKDGNIFIHRKKTIKYRGALPEDARQKGYRKRVIQGIKIEPYNTEYRLERFYSESTGKLYESQLPPGEGANHFSGDILEYLSAHG